MEKIVWRRQNSKQSGKIKTVPRQTLKHSLHYFFSLFFSILTPRLASPRLALRRGKVFSNLMKLSLLCECLCHWPSQSAQTICFISIRIVCRIFSTMTPQIPIEHFFFRSLFVAAVFLVPGREWRVLDAAARCVCMQSVRRC